MPDIQPPPTLLTDVPAEALQAISNFYRCLESAAAEPDPFDRLLTFAGLLDAPATCARLTARLFACLVPQYSVDHPEGEPVTLLHRRLTGYLEARSPEVRRRARIVLAAALGLLAELPEALTDAESHELDPEWIEAAAEALHVGLTYVTGCFDIPGLTAADVLEQCVAA